MRSVDEQVRRLMAVAWYCCGVGPLPRNLEKRMHYVAHHWIREGGNRVAFHELCTLIEHRIDKLITKEFWRALE